MYLTIVPLELLLLWEVLFCHSQQMISSREFGKISGQSRNFDKVFKTVADMTSTACALNCYRDDQCIGFNYASNTAMDPNCELVGKRIETPTELTPDKYFDYYEEDCQLILTNNPCQNGGLPHLNLYSTCSIDGCFCPPSTRGQMCEKDCEFIVCQNCQLMNIGDMYNITNPVNIDVCLRNCSETPPCESVLFTTINNDQVCFLKYESQFTYSPVGQENGVTLYSLYCQQ